MQTDGLPPGSAFEVATTQPRPPQDERTPGRPMPDTSSGESSIVGHPGRRWRDRLSALLEEEAADAPPMEDDPFPAAAAQRRMLRGRLMVAVKERAKEEAREEAKWMAAQKAAREPGGREPGGREPGGRVVPREPHPMASSDPEVLAKAELDRARLAALSFEELTAKLKAQNAARKARRLKKEADLRARAQERKAKSLAAAKVAARWKAVAKAIRVAPRRIKDAIKAVGSAKIAKRRAVKASAMLDHRNAVRAVREARRALAEAKARRAAANARLVRKTGFPGLPEPEDMFPPPVDGPIRDAAWLAQQQEEFYTLNLKRMEEERRQYLKDMRKADKERHVKTVIRKLYGRLRKALALKIHHLNKALAAAESEEARAAVQAEIDRAGAAMQVPEEEILATLAEAEASVRAFIGKGEVVVKAPAVSLATENSGFSKARRRKAPRDPHARRAAQAGKPKVPRIPRGQKEAEQIATPRDLKEPPITAAAAGLLDDLLK